MIHTGPRSRQVHTSASQRVHLSCRVEHDILVLSLRKWFRRPSRNYYLYRGCNGFPFSRLPACCIELKGLQSQKSIASIGECVLSHLAAVHTLPYPFLEAAVLVICVLTTHNLGENVTFAPP
jgi:hypothetical protein